VILDLEAPAAPAVLAATVAFDDDKLQMAVEFAAFADDFPLTYAVSLGRAQNAADVVALDVAACSAATGGRIRCVRTLTSSPPPGSFFLTVEAIDVAGYSTFVHADTAVLLFASDVATGDVAELLPAQGSAGTDLDLLLDSQAQVLVAMRGDWSAIQSLDCVAELVDQNGVRRAGPAAVMPGLPARFSLPLNSASVPRIFGRVRCGDGTPSIMAMGDGFQVLSANTPPSGDVTLDNDPAFLPSALVMGSWSVTGLASQLPLFEVQLGLARQADGPFEMIGDSFAGHLPVGSQRLPLPRERLPDDLDVVYLSLHVRGCVAPGECSAPRRSTSHALVLTGPERAFGVASALVHAVAGLSDDDAKPLSETGLANDDANAQQTRLEVTLPTYTTADPGGIKRYTLHVRAVHPRHAVQTPAVSIESCASAACTWDAQGLRIPDLLLLQSDSGESLSAALGGGISSMVVEVIIDDSLGQSSSLVIDIEAAVGFTDNAVVDVAPASLSDVAGVSENALSALPERQFALGGPLAAAWPSLEDSGSSFVWWVSAQAGADVSAGEASFPNCTTIPDVIDCGIADRPYALGHPHAVYASGQTYRMCVRAVGTSADGAATCSNGVRVGALPIVAGGAVSWDINNSKEARDSVSRVFTGETRVALRWGNFSLLGQASGSSAVPYVIEVALGTSPGGQDVLPWDLAPSHGLKGAIFLPTTMTWPRSTPVYGSVRARLAWGTGGNAVATTTSALILDDAAPTCQLEATPSQGLNSAGERSARLHLHWSVADTFSPLTRLVGWIQDVWIFCSAFLFKPRIFLPVASSCDSFTRSLFHFFGVLSLFNVNLFSACPFSPSSHGPSALLLIPNAPLLQQSTASYLQRGQRHRSAHVRVPI
jgi:hypothetical protein